MRGTSLPLTTVRRAIQKLRKSDERGATFVEFAFVFPVFILILVGIMEFAFMFAQQNELKHLAREGARIAAVEDIASDQIADRLRGRIGLLDEGSFVFAVGSFDANTSDPAGSTGAVGNACASVNIRFITGLLGPLLPDVITIDTATNFYVEAPNDTPAVWSACRRTGLP